MSNISYEMHNGAIRVRLGRKIVGEIRKCEGGYRYHPKGSRVTGQTFSTVDGVKHSLEVSQ